MNSGNCRPTGQFCQTVYRQTARLRSYTNIVGNMMFRCTSDGNCRLNLYRRRDGADDERAREQLTIAGLRPR